MFDIVEWKTVKEKISEEVRKFDWKKYGDK